MVKLKKPKVGSLKTANYPWCLYFAGVIIVWTPWGSKVEHLVLVTIGVLLMFVPVVVVLKKMHDNHVRFLVHKEMLEFYSWLHKQNTSGPTLPPKPQGKRLQEL